MEEQSTSEVSGLTTLKVKEPKERVLRSLSRIFVPAGELGYIDFPFSVQEIKPQHAFRFAVNVQQNGRTDLDIGFSVMDDGNYHKWLARQPSSAFLIAHRFKYGSMIFTPSVTGSYHAILDNKYSVLTPKQVDFTIFESWLEEKEVKLPLAEKPKEEIGKPKLRLWQRILNRLRYSRTLQVISLLLFVQLFCFLLVLMIAYLFSSTLGIEPKDSIGYMATAIGGSSVAVSIYLYFAITGKSLPSISPA